MNATILVTGGNRGIGLAMCKALAARGCRVLLGCRDIQKGQQVAKQIREDVTAVALDLSNPTTIAQQMVPIIDDYAPITGLINNAAILVEGNALEVSSDDFSQTLDINLKAPFEMCRAILPLMIKQGYGRVVNVTSSWGAFATGMEGPAAYSVSKAALNAMTLSLSRDLPENVTINAMDPGWVKTDMGGSEALTSPEHAAETAVFLVMGEDAGPNGQFFRDKKPIPW